MTTKTSGWQVCREVETLIAEAGLLTLSSCETPHISPCTRVKA